MTSKPFDKLKQKLGAELRNITVSREASRETLKKLNDIDFFPESGPADNLQIVVYGSLARGEWTSGSDLDWTLLVDGPSDPGHLKLVQRISTKLESAGFQSPSPYGAFGSMSSSHELIHMVGGAKDTNENLTRRMLLLLESFTIPDPSDRVVLTRVTRQILSRYIDCDPSISRMNSTQSAVPRFLLNDVVRYWRTMAVDYAAKKWEQRGKWALRNAKLRMSRKLIFTKGLLMCLGCGNLPDQKSSKEMNSALIEYCEDVASLSAIDVLCKHLLGIKQLELAEKLLVSYDGFLGIINDEGKREHLASLEFEKAALDPVFNEVRELGKKFQAGLSELFFDPANGLAKLTKEYGVF